jgi:integrase
VGRNLGFAHTMTSTSSLEKASRRSRSQGLSATFVRQVKSPGRYGDGGGLYLVVDPSGASRWILRVMSAGRRRDIGLGSTRVIALADARDKARELRRIAKSGEDPVAARRAGSDGVPTFEECAKAVHKSRMATWKNGKHTSQWLATLEAYVFPLIGKLSVNRVGTAEILKILLPIWTQKPETARRVLQRVSKILDYGTASGFRGGENPCRLAVIGLPTQRAEPRHFTALPYVELPDFLVRLRSADASEIVKLAFEFLILTAGRTGEVLGARESEIDSAKALWVVPRERMKASREHVVPLSARALEILARAKELCPESDLIFPSPQKPDSPLSNMAFSMLLRRMNVKCTSHGFRSSFRDWCSEESDFPSEVAEMALAHAVSNKVEAAYRRGSLLAKRRLLADRWSQFCCR